MRFSARACYGKESAPLITSLQQIKFRIRRTGKPHSYPAADLLTDFFHSAKLNSTAGACRNTGRLFSLFQKVKTQVAFLHMTVCTKLRGAKATCPGTETASYTLLGITNYNPIFCSLTDGTGWT
jgi:hypothetical protein